jgi:hypothetical protein
MRYFPEQSNRNEGTKGEGFGERERWDDGALSPKIGG